MGAEPPRPGEGGAAGPPGEGWLAVNDARLVAFPVPTLENCFAWVSSPLLLAGLSRYTALAGMAGVPAVPVVTPGSAVPADPGRWGEGELCLGSYLCPRAGTARDQQAVASWASGLACHALPNNPSFEYFREKFKSHFVLVDDDLLVELTEEFSELVPRVQLGHEPGDDKEPGNDKIVQNLFYEEDLPSETLVVSFLASMRPGKDAAAAASKFDGHVVQVGGSETVGRGLTWAAAPRASKWGTDGAGA
jgi:CRISPR-associated protein Cmr4